MPGELEILEENIILIFMLEIIILYLSHTIVMVVSADKKADLQRVGMLMLSQV